MLRLRLLSEYGLWVCCIPYFHGVCSRPRLETDGSSRVYMANILCSKSHHLNNNPMSDTFDGLLSNLRWKESSSRSGITVPPNPNWLTNPLAMRTHFHHIGDLDGHLFFGQAKKRTISVLLAQNGVLNWYRGGNVIPGWDQISTKTTQNVVRRTTVPMYRQLLRNHLKIDHGEWNHWYILSWANLVSKVEDSLLLSLG